MFVELAIGIKAIVIIVSLIGLFLGLFPDIDLFHKKETSVVSTDSPIDNEWAALAYAPDTQTRDDVLQAIQAHQLTDRQADDNATRLALYRTHQDTTHARYSQGMNIMLWTLLGCAALAFPLPNRRMSNESD